MSMSLFRFWMSETLSGFAKNAETSAYYRLLLADWTLLEIYFAELADDERVSILLDGLVVS